MLDCKSGDKKNCGGCREVRFLYFALIGLSSGLDLALAMLAGEFDSHTIHCDSPMLV